MRRFSGKLPKFSFPFFGRKPFRFPCGVSSGENQYISVSHLHQDIRNNVALNAFLSLAVGDDYLAWWDGGEEELKFLIGLIPGDGERPRYVAIYVILFGARIHKNRHTLLEDCLGLRDPDEACLSL